MQWRHVVIDRHCGNETTALSVVLHIDELSIVVAACECHFAVDVSVFSKKQNIFAPECAPNALHTRCLIATIVGAQANDARYPVTAIGRLESSLAYEKITETEI